MENVTYTIEQLSEKTGYSIRTIRYYIQEGLLEPPAGRGRGGYYYDSHLRRLLEIKAMQDRGMKLVGIQEMLKRGEAPTPVMEREIWVKCPVVPGFELHITKDVEERERRKIDEIIRIAKSILEEDQNDD
jgi:DNA-binding transcriptional MerR regulator